MSNRCLKELNLLDRYATNRNDPIADFYSPCLERSVRYDRAVGYFHSTILLLAAQSIADLAQLQGKIRLICSPELTEHDIEAIKKGYELRTRIGETLLQTIEQALEDIRSKTLLEFVATLIAVGCLDIRVAFRPGAWGIFHDKVGVLYDFDGHSISFTGSSNETFRAWDLKGNHESFDVFRSWTTEGSRVNQHIKYFNSLWNGEEPGVETIHFPEVALNRLVSVSNTDGIKAAYIKITSSSNQARKKIPQTHQLMAIEAWKQRGYKGILQHATGSGKTITAITAMRDWLKQDYPILVLVPSELLLDYWQKEIQTELKDLDPTILMVGGGYSEWRKKGVVEGFTTGKMSPRVIIATLQTAATHSFLKRVQSGGHLMLIIDEVHRAGSPMLSKVLSIDAGSRLGLSATPHRYGDPEGTEKILRYFDGIIEPPFTLEDAISAGRLCNYTYYIHPTSLSNEEIHKWRELTKEIKRRYAKVNKDDPKDAAALKQSIKRLLIKRADILKNAEAKIPLAVQVLKQHYNTGQKWLIYCDDQLQLQGVSDVLQEAGFPCGEFYSSMLSSKAATLDYFMVKGGIIVAIKCLDEGVDLPAVDHALILASSRNPREFIQRRGRVLRFTEGKYYAEIHDAFIIPPKSNDPDEISILSGELSRAMQFAISASNKAVKIQLRQIAYQAGIDPDKIFSNDNVEEE